MSLIFITSPAKSMDETEGWSAAQTTKPEYQEQANELVKHLQKKSKKELAEMMKMSDSLAELNYDRFQEWNRTVTSINAKPAILLYKGDIYKQFDAPSFSKQQQWFTQDSLRIITGMYGILRPYDLIQPYRLEMKTKLDFIAEKNLADYWSGLVTKALNQAASETKTDAVINLCSKEYAKAIDEAKLQPRFITVDFKEIKDGKPKTVAIYAKQARGAMIGWAIKNQVESLEQLREFNQVGYKLDNETTDTLTFVR